MSLANAVAERKRTKPPSPADRAVRFINNLSHSSGDFARESFRLRPWQERIVRTLFGTLKPNGKRQYRTCLLMLPRKNGKSELAAALALYGLLGDGENAAQVYSAAADRDQAALVFNAAVTMVRADPELEAQLEIVESQKRIVHRASNGFYRAISAEAFSKHGFNASMVIYDELHSAPNRELWDVLRTSQGARSQPVMLAISTAGFDRHSILYQVYDYACKVRDGIVTDETFLPIIYEAPPEANWLDESVWAACNPALGDFRSLEDMQILAREAQAMPGAENSFRRLYLNQWTEQETRWLPMPLWDACAGEIADLSHRRCYIGMDLSTTRDLTALVAVFPDDAGGCDVLPAFFVPEESIHERAKRDRVPYPEWQKSGHLIATPGDVVSYEAVRVKLQEWAERFDVREVAFDPWNATDLVTRLQDQDGFTCVPMRQGYASLSAPTKSAEKLIASKALRHDGHPVLRWNVSNAAVETDAVGNIKLSKRASTERIDGAMALIMAVDRMDRNAASVSADTSVFAEWV